MQSTIIFGLHKIFPIFRDNPSQTRNYRDAAPPAKVQYSRV